MKSLVLLFLLVLYGSIQLEAKSANNCNDNCQTKLYSLSKDGTIGCSGANCLMEASFRSTLVNGQIVFNVNLIGYGFSSYQDPGFSVTLTKSSTETQYHCYPGSYGTGQARVYSKSGDYFNGSSQVTNGNLYCSWYMTQTDKIWPRSGSDAADLQSDRYFNIYFVIGSKRFPIASDIADLPIYHLQSLKCCHKVHGDDKYQLIVSQSGGKTHFFLQGFDSYPRILSAEFSDSNGRQLVFDCYLSNSYMKAYLKTDATTDDITSQASLSSFVKPAQCSWSLPTTISGSFSAYETKNGVYDLQILVDSEVVYTESNVSLRGFGTKTISSFILIFSSIAIHLLIN